jgi:hypothetical protein
MQPVLEAPDDAVPQLHAELLANAVNEDVNGENFAIGADVIADLPAQAAIVGQCPVRCLDRLFLLFKVVIEFQAFLVFLADVIGRGRND